ncbi:MAG: AAA family ATPase [Halanaeroarchaeum sp.]
MTDSRVYAIASGKGGVGKTTSAVNLGAAVVEAGRSAVVVDLDLGMANLEDFLEVSSTPATLHDVLADDAPIDDAIASGPAGVDVVPGSDDIEAFGRADPAGLREVVADLRKRYDVVILDTGGGLSHDTTLPLGLADDVVIVTTPDAAAINNAAKTRDLVDRLDGTVEGVVLTRIGGVADDAQGDVRSQIDGRILGSVPEDSNVPASAAAGEPLVAMDRNSPAAQSYREIGYALLDEPLPRDWADDGQESGTASGLGTGASDGADDDIIDASAVEQSDAVLDDEPESAGDIASAIETAETTDESADEAEDIVVAESAPPEDDSTGESGTDDQSEWDDAPAGDPAESADAGHGTNGEAEPDDVAVGSDDGERAAESDDGDGAIESDDGERAAESDDGERAAESDDGERDVPKDADAGVPEASRDLDEEGHEETASTAAESSDEDGRDGADDEGVEIEQDEEPTEESSGRSLLSRLTGGRLG